MWKPFTLSKWKVEKCQWQGAELPMLVKSWGEQGREIQSRVVHMGLLLGKFFSRCWTVLEAALFICSVLARRDESCERRTHLRLMFNARLASNISPHSPPSIIPHNTASDAHRCFTEVCRPTHAGRLSSVYTSFSLWGPLSYQRCGLWGNETLSREQENSSELGEDREKEQGCVYVFGGD